jgi:hypothetical protein
VVAPPSAAAAATDHGPAFAARAAPTGPALGPRRAARGCADADQRQLPEVHATRG